MSMIIFVKFGINGNEVEIDEGPCFGNGEYDEQTETCKCDETKAYGERCQFTEVSKI